MTPLYIFVGFIVVITLGIFAALALLAHVLWEDWKDRKHMKASKLYATPLDYIRECERLGIPWEDCVSDPAEARRQLERTIH